MKRFLYCIAAAALFAGVNADVYSQKLVLIGTNDTHSQIDPDEDGLGGVLRRKVVIDSIRAANDNVLLIDMGDAVQGTMYFNLYRGKVENMVMDELGYDLRILGNHDFDNGVDELADNLNKTHSEYVSTNYRFDDAILSTLFRPYIVKDIEGKKVAFLGVNLKPKGMISEGNYDGVEYLDAIKAANATAWHLKHNEDIDYVVALTHIGYAPSGTGTSDTELAKLSEDIDLIMGGHSHTLLKGGQNDTESRIINANGDTVLITQAGKAGKEIAVVEIDLAGKNADYKTISIDGRLDDRLDSALDAKLAPYRKGVDDVMNKPVGKLSASAEKGSDALLNLVADLIRDRGRQLDPDIDFAITNRGGIRRGLPKGTITQGQIQSMLPFNNKVVVLEIKGSDLLDAFQVMTGSYGAGVSDEVTVVTNSPNGVLPIINGEALDPDKTYKIATIDYLANGGDYMEPLTRATWVAQSPDKVYDDVLIMLTKGKYKGKTLKPDSKSRFVTANSIGLYF